MDEAGNGSSVVLLPALSSISTREEMLPLLDRLSSQFRVSTVVAWIWRPGPPTRELVPRYLVGVPRMVLKGNRFTAPRHHCGGACGDLCTASGGLLSRHGRATRIDRANLAWTATDDDGW